MIHAGHVLRNELLRSLLSVAIRGIGLSMRREMQRAIARFERTQEELRARYGLDEHVPLRTYDAQVREAVEAFARTRSDVRFAYTSGSTREPKKIAFTPERLRSIKRGSLSVVSRLMLERKVRRPQLFILSGLKEDDSLSSLLLDGKSDGTPLITGLLMPARHLAEPPFPELVQTYGATACRMLLLVLANPGVLYSTNPSTLALFLGDVQGAWLEASRLVRELFHGDSHLAARLVPVMRAIAAPGWQERFRRIASSERPLPFGDLAPAVEMYCCWDGGYVRPFLEQIRAHLPPERYQHIPMYSMATETMETLTHFDGDEVRFLPVAREVLYEFLPEGAPDDPRALVPAHELEPQKNYTMVVSDPYGLTRYHTEDVFACVARVGSAPDLRFLRRRGLAFSFTGEKLTDQHVSLAYEASARTRSELHGVQFTVIPSRPPGGAPPCYRLVLAPPRAGASLDLLAIAHTFDSELSEVNREYADKRASRRLSPVQAHLVPYDRLAARVDPKSRAGEEAQRGWDTQFKLLPLLTRTWEELGFDDAR